MLSFLKKRIRFAIDALIVIFVLIMILQKIPSWISLSQKEGLSYENMELFKGELKTMLPNQDKLVIFVWATWCGPCQIELARLNRFYKKNPKLNEKIISLSIGEKTETVMATAKSRDYVFPIWSDPENKFGGLFSIASTPTVLFFENQKLSSSLIGISPLLEIRLKNFLD